MHQSSQKILFKTFYIKSDALSVLTGYDIDCKQNLQQKKYLEISFSLLDLKIFAKRECLRETSAA